MLDRLTDQFEAASGDFVQTHRINRDGDWFMFKLQEEAGELVQAYNRLTGRSRAKGRSPEDLVRDLADETGDLLGHLLLFARHNDLDLAAAIARKWRFSPHDERENEKS